MKTTAKTIYLVLLLISFCMSSAAHSAEYDTAITLPTAQKFSLPVSAMIKSVNISSGQKIKEGDEIIVLDQAPFVVAKTHAKANVTVHESQLKEAQRDLLHHQELYDRTVLSAVDLENVEMREKRVRAHLVDAKAQLEVAEYNLSYSKLISPFDAVVMSVHVNPGQYLNNSQQSHTLVSLVRQGSYQVQFGVTAEALSSIEIDQGVTVISMGSRYPGKVSSINYQAADGNDGKIIVSAEFAGHVEYKLIGNKAIVRID